MANAVYVPETDPYVVNRLAIVACIRHKGHILYKAAHRMC